MYKCPGCGAPLRFDPKSQKLGCMFCGRQVDPRDPTLAYANEAEGQTPVGGTQYDSQTGEQEYAALAYVCPNCGAKLLSTEETAATFCSFCGSNVVLDERLDAERKERVKETVEELHALGVRMGIVSNIISTSLVPHMLNEYGIAQYMETVVMSAGTGIRKPDPRIFAIAMQRMGVTAAETGYVGDTVSRDVRGARNAKMGLVIRIENPSIAHRDVGFTGEDAPKPDFVIQALDEIPGIIRRINHIES